VLLVVAAFVIAAPMFEKKPQQPIFAEVKARPLPPAPPVAPPPPAIAPPPPAVAPPVPVPPPVAVETKAKAPPPRTKVVKPPPRKAQVVLASVPSSDPDVKRAQALLQKGDTRAAIRELNLAIAKNPKSPEPYPTLGDAYALTGNKNGAIAAYRRYLVLSPRGDGAKKVEKALSRLGGRSP